MEVVTHGFRAEFFAKSIVYCVQMAIEADKQYTSDLWLIFAKNDIKMCIKCARKEGKL